MKVLSRVSEDRRVNAYARAGSFCCTPGIQRIIDKALEKMREQDQYYNSFDFRQHPKLIRNYSLENHCCREAMVIGRYAEEAGWSSEMRQVAIAAAKLHDVGKTEEQPDPEVGLRPYRIYGTYNRRQAKKKHDHQRFSANFIYRMRKQIRRNGSDAFFIRVIWTMVRFHHHPEKIRNKKLRNMTFALHCIDIFVSLMEDRNRPELETTLAIDALELILKKPRYKRFKCESGRIIRRLRAIYVFVPAEAKVAS